MQIYYFTRTGRSKDIALELAKRQGTQPLKIDDRKNWQGIFRYVKAGFFAATKKSLPATYQKPNPKEPVVVVFPVWAGGFPPAVKTFINEIGRDKITAIPTSLGSNLKDRSGFKKVIDLVGKEIFAPEL